MAKSIDVIDIEPIDLSTNDSYPSSISELAEHFLKGESWVKHSKNILREVYWWQVNDLFDESGSLTYKGFQKMQELFDRTSNTRIVEKRGKRQSERRKPEMSVEDFKVWIWTSNRKFPTGFSLEQEEDLVSTQVASQGSDGAIELELEEIETHPYDPTAQLEENTALILSAGGLANQRNQTSFDQSLSRIKEYIAAKVENVIIEGITTGQNRGMAKAVETLESDLPQDVAPVQVKTQKKSASRSRSKS